MFKRIVRIFIVLLIVIAVLAFGGTSLSQFGKDIRIRNPIEVFGPLINRFGINLNLEKVDESSGSLIVKKPKPNNQNVPTNSEELNELIENIKVIDHIERDGYKREIFEKPSRSYELDGKKYNRNDYAWKTSPYLESEDPFVYNCPYTGIKIEDESKLDYDHIIPIKYVWDVCHDWTNEQYNEYSYAQSIGVDVWYSANRSKSDKRPSEWLPDINIGNYCYTWLCIANEWDIPLFQEDIDVCIIECNKVLDSGQKLERID